MRRAAEKCPRHARSGPGKPLVLPRCPSRDREGRASISLPRRSLGHSKEKSPILRSSRARTLQRCYSRSRSQLSRAGRARPGLFAVRAFSSSGESALPALSPPAIPEVPRIAGTSRPSAPRRCALAASHPSRAMPSASFVFYFLFSIFYILFSIFYFLFFYSAPNSPRTAHKASAPSQYHWSP